MLKFEGKFKVGQKIKAFDFMPTSDRPDSYLVGTVIDENCDEHGFKSFKVVITKRVFGGVEETAEIGDFGWVPQQVAFMEYDGRIVEA